MSRWPLVTISDWERALLKCTGVQQVFAADAPDEHPFHVFFFVVGGNPEHLDGFIRNYMGVGLAFTLFHREAPEPVSIARIPKPRPSRWRRALRWLSELGEAK